MDSLRNAAHGAFKKAAEAVLPPLTKSQFEEKRVLTPDEFVRAGDYLVRACPTWAWESGDPKKARPYLPANKQFLVTRGVPCLRRAADLERAAEAGAGGIGAGAGGASAAGGFDPKKEYALTGEDEGWTATHRDPAAAAAAGAAAGAAGGAGPAAAAGAAGPAATTAAAANPQAAAANAAAADDDLPDLADLEVADEATVSASTRPAAAAAATAPNNAAALVSTRTYDLHVTYDQYYRVPRLWLVGFDERGAPLSADQVLEDVSEEHARKTITVEPHPHGASSSGAKAGAAAATPAAAQAASIHPCRHAEVMKRLADRAAAAPGGRPLAVEGYLVLFLKFIASVVPTIQYDYTMET